MKAYFELTKSGIVLFVLLSGLAGYAISFEPGQDLELWRLILLAFGLYFVSSGSFALNQAQESKLDSLMPRTQKRPIPSGVIHVWQAVVLGISFCFFGLFLLFLVSPMSALVSLVTIFLYNIFYTCFWKPRMSFGAVPGAIPGALPVVIGYAANNPQIFNPESVYLFMVMFLWQMPHFWCLAIRFKEDYRKGGIPVLPASQGTPTTIYYIGLYVFAYVGVAMAAPWFLKANILFLFLIIPMSIKLIVEFFRFFRAQGNERWMPFFMWVNMSVLVYLGVPIFDKWFYLAANF